MYSRIHFHLTMNFVASETNFDFLSLKNPVPFQGDSIKTIEGQDVVRQLTVEARKIRVTTVTNVSIPAVNTLSIIDTGIRNAKPA